MPIRNPVTCPSVPEKVEPACIEKRDAPECTCIPTPLELMFARLWSLAINATLVASTLMQIAGRYVDFDVAHELVDSRRSDLTACADDAARGIAHLKRLCLRNREPSDSERGGAPRQGGAPLSIFVVNPNFSLVNHAVLRH